MRTLTIIILLLLVLPAIALPPANGIASGTGYLFLDDYTAQAQPRVEKGQVWPVERRIVAKGPVKRAVERTLDRKGKPEPVWIEEYDRAGRMTLHVEYDSQGLRYKEIISYDRYGARRAVMTSSAWQRERRYDAAGRLLSEVGYRLKAGKAPLRTERNSYQYDGAGREVAMETWRLPLSNGAPHPLTGTITSRLAADGRPLEETNNIGNDTWHTTWQYDSKNRVTAMRNANGRDGTGKLIAQVAFTYDDAGHLLSRENRDASGHRREAQINSYNAQGHLLTREFYARGVEGANARGYTDRIVKGQDDSDAPLVRKWVFTYDEQQRLVKTAFFDGKGQPVCVPHPASQYLSARPAPGIAGVRYSYDATGTPHWTAYDLDGTPIADSFKKNPRPAAAPRPTPPKPTYTYDKHGNWVRVEVNGVVRVRTIAYY